MEKPEGNERRSTLIGRENEVSGYKIFMTRYLKDVYCEALVFISEVAELIFMICRIAKG